MRTRSAGLALVFLIASSALGCADVWGSLSAGFAYREAPLPPAQVRLDVPYRMDDAAHPDKHRLDLFLPDAGAEGWPTLVFVHGGGWTAGDRATNVLGLEPNRNIGRFYAARGVGVAILSYRLQPEVTWRDQIADIADAVAWVHREIAREGGNPEALILSGHSAGAWLAAWLGLSDVPLARVSIDRSIVCGLVLVSGAGYDLEDEKTYELGASRPYFEDLFGDDDPDWARSASILLHLDRPYPPTLVLSAEGEPEKFRRQGDMLFDAVVVRAPFAKRVVVPGSNHQKIVVSMSRADDLISDSVLSFIGETRCRGSAG